VISAILTDFGRMDFPPYLEEWADDRGKPEEGRWLYYADFCIGDDAEGDPVGFRITQSIPSMGIDREHLVVNRRDAPGYDPEVHADLLQFGNSEEAQEVRYWAYFREESTDYFLENLVVGRQYVFNLPVVEDDLDEYMPWRRALVAFLKGESPEPPEKLDMFLPLVWFIPDGKL